MSSVRRLPIIHPKPADGSRLAPFNLPAVTSFHNNLPGYAPSPLVSLPGVAADLGIKGVYIKDESSRFGLPSFKILGASYGAYYALVTSLGLSLDCNIDTLASKARESGSVLFAATDGNHGRAVAFMAKLLSIEARIFVPRSLDEYTKEAIAGEGAKVILGPGDYDQVVAFAAEASKACPGGVLVQDTSFPGYEDVPARIVEGYSTIFREIDDQIAEQNINIDLFISPAGVGSLAHSVLRYYKSLQRPVCSKVVTVEPDTAACLYKSLQARADASTPVTTSHTIMTGLNCGTVTYSAWPDFRDCLDGSVTISDFEAHSSVKELKAYGIDSGPCGAAGLAALRYLMASSREELGLGKDSVVVLLNTEGARPYTTPHDVTSDDPVELTRILTRIESTNPTLSLSAGSGEEAIADFIEGWLEHRDIESHRIQSQQGRPSVVGKVTGTGNGRSLMMNGHIDTVSLAAYTKDPLSGDLTEKNGRPAVVGRGSLDMKAGTAAAMVALAHAKKSQPRGSVLLAAVADEEDTSIGTVDILEAGWRADAAVIPEPTMLQLGTSHRGFLWFEVEILGTAAHGSRPDLGVDAIMNAGLFLSSLKEYTNRLPIDDVLGPASAHCGLIEGGEELSSYPASCKVKIEFRTVPAQRAEQIQDDLVSILEKHSKTDASFRFQPPKLLVERPALKLSSSEPIVKAAISAAKSTANPLVEPQALSFWCDAALLTEAGIPAVVFGPEGEGLHAKEEWVYVESIHKTTAMLDNLISDFCQ
ncbi:hypothetical protein PFICI_01993 [Pestalotiopsis fici W106-1]|uniref:Succinyl-diaminopimelate desuccinylase n=1 Tax=Pestalotiopsis fici (strain W106-1 / CGMCC3.15140) TaxID=1229662 RepID=W3XQB6_PESFW|nr:uncharacterized protein PFICI_01993 [Pestalotiopsis fici W106-1]ETS88165.1 hypothetical protein PFICI_01993 [Pestalotiopsis fici W106-1]